MIIYKKAPFDCQMKNMILLDDHISNGCVYVDVNTYNQALSLMITYSKDYDRIFEADAGADADWKSKKEWKDRIKKAWDGMPEPLNALAPYLGHLSSVDGLAWAADDETFAEQVYGYLHVMSTVVDFFHTTTLKAEMRQTIMLPRHLLEGYNKAWDLLTQGLDKTVTIVEESRHDVTSELTNAVSALKELVSEIKGMSVTPVAAPVVAPTSTPEPVKKEEPIVVAMPVTEVKEEPKVETTPAPTDTNAESNTGDTSDDEIDEDIEKFLKEMQARWAEEDAEEERKKKEKEEEKIMTEDIRREKDIAEKSLATMNSYDL